MSELQQRVYQVVAQELGLKAEDIKSDNKFIDDLGADSIDMVEICMALEEVFETELSDEVFDRVVTVQDLIDLLERLGIKATD